jgi:coproporphyrinogen III oxidase-like Fe-S oxidoreductase
VDAEALQERFEHPIVDWRAVDRQSATGHSERDGGRVRLTPAGRLLLDRILGEIAA